MSDKDLYVEVARQKAQTAQLQSQMAALENIVYKRTTAPSPLPRTERTDRFVPVRTERLAVEAILKDLDVALSDRLAVVNENEVRAREYFSRKDDWSTINKLLKQHGFKWVSQGKQSCWRRT